MTAFTVTAAQNIDALASKAGGDTYAINGGTLTIDQDSRYGLNQSISTSLGSITISSTQGGAVEVDARAVRLIPYSSGSGNVPAAGTTISQGGTTGVLIGVWSAINSAPTASGSAMPATGFIKVKQVSGAYASGALTGIGASATGADVVGWIELVGDENGNVTVPRLGLFRMRGGWFDVGTTTGVNTNTYQLPTSGRTFYAAGVWVETGYGTGVYEFYPCAGSLVASASVGTDAVRGKVCWISTAGVLRFGHDGTNSNTGYCPPSGRKIRIPNIITQNCTTANRTANALPNATLGTRYDFTTTGGGQISIDKALLAWYPSFTTAYSVAMSYVGVLEQVLISTIPTPLNWTQVGVGQCAAQAQQALNMTYCYQGGTMTDCVWSRATLAGSSVVQRQSCSGFTFLRDRIFPFAVRTSNSVFATSDSLLENCTYDTPTIIGSEARLSAGLNVNYTSVIYSDNITGTSGTANAVSAIHLTGACNGIKIDGFSFGGLANCHPYGYLVSVDNASGAGAKNIIVQNIGTYASPLDLGSVNPCNGAYNVLSASMGGTNKVRRVYTSNTRSTSPFFNVGSDSYGFVFENCFGDYADSGFVRVSGVKLKGYGGTPDMSAQTGYYDQTWIDCFTSPTAGRIIIMMNEPASQMASYVTLASGASFAGAGSLYMPTVGMSATFEMDYYAIGHTGFANSALVMGGGTATQYDYRYQIDKNDGAGWSAWSATKTPTTLGTALNAETSIDASKGLKLKLEIKTNTINSNAITSVYIETTSTTTTQAYQYPLDTAPLTIQNVVSGSAWRVEDSSDNSLIASGTAIGGDINVSVVYSGSPRTLRVKVRKGTAAPKYLPFETLVVVSASGGTTYVSQIADTIAA